MAAITKSHQIFNQLRSEIDSGRWAPGERISGEVELCAELGVSRNTLRDALSLLAQEGIIVKKRGAGTFIAETPSVPCIMITSDAGNLASPVGQWHRTLVEGCQSRIADAGMKAVLAVGHGRSDEEFISSINLSAETLKSEISGIIELSFRSSLQRFLQSTAVPLVQIVGAAATCTYAVVHDTSSMVQLAVKALQDSGHHDFALMHHDMGDPSLWDATTSETMRLIRAAVNNDESRLVPVPGDPCEGLAMDVFKEWWSRPDRPNSMFFSDDSLFDLASRAILELGIKVPDELAVITHANIGRALHFPMRMTRVGFDPCVLAAQAWQMLHKLILGEPVFDAVVKIPAMYFEGESLSISRDGDSSGNDELGFGGGAYMAEVKAGQEQMQL